MENSRTSTSIGQLILVPSIITLAITLLRLYGELHNWSQLFFGRAAGGGSSIVGISWLPLILGPYFALKLARAGQGPSGAGKAIGFAALGFGVMALGGYLIATTVAHPSPLTLLGFLVALAAAFVATAGWKDLGKTLIAYAYAARIPVVVVMFFAMQGNGGDGWGTHYDVVSPDFVHRFWPKFVDFALLPQMCIWIGFTVVIGTLLGGITAAIVGRKTTAPSTAQPAAS